MSNYLFWHEWYHFAAQFMQMAGYYQVKYLYNWATEGGGDPGHPMERPAYDWSNRFARDLGLEFPFQ